MNIAYSGYIVACKKVNVKNCKKSSSLSLLLLAPALSFAIDAPKQPRGTQVKPTEIKWEWKAVSGAARYDVIVNGQFKGQVTETHFYSRNLPAGEHHMSVKAISANWKYSKNSARAYRSISGGQSSSGNSSSSQQAQASSGNSAPQQQSQPSSESASVSTPSDPRALRSVLAS